MMSDKQIELLKAQAKLREQVQKMINQSASPTSFEKILDEFRLNNSKLVSIGRIDHEYFNKKIFESTMAEVTLYKSKEKPKEKMVLTTTEPSTSQKAMEEEMLKSSNEEAYQTDRSARRNNPILEKLEMRLASLREEMEIAQEYLRQL
ncbi:GH24024 [Drosophila grimshawi]|uniref:GH24024 n=1 Tax=Drosophila grimshawi TaxID=7222 RepID=B4K3M2_DROGR|nr:GH24024 [Drosophila grimshawi]